MLNEPPPTIGLPSCASAVAGAAPPDQSGEHSGSGGQAGDQVGEDGAGELGVAGLAEQRIQATYGLADGVVGGAVAQRAAVAEAVHRAVDQVRA